MVSEITGDYKTERKERLLSLTYLLNPSAIIYISYREELIIVSNEIHIINHT